MSGRIFLSAKALIQLNKYLLVSGMCLLLSACFQAAPRYASQASAMPFSDASSMPQAIRKLVTTADQQFDNQQYQSSLDTLERAIRIRPRQAEVWTRMARANLQLQHYSNAIQFAKRANNYNRNNDSLRQFNLQIIQQAKSLQMNQPISETSD